MLAISRCIYYPRRPCIRSFPYFRSINVHGIINYPAAAVWSVNISNVINTHITVVGNLPDLIDSGTGYISTVVINIGVVNNGCTVNNVYHAGLRYIIVVNVWSVNISLWCTNPVIIGHIVTIAKRYIDADARL